jgi:beta-glucanase (GH16 family)
MLPSPALQSAALVSPGAVSADATHVTAAAAEQPPPLPVVGALHSDPELALQGWRMVWADEFEGTSLNTSNWEVMLGDGRDYFVEKGWGNNEVTPAAS